jgi:ABC-type Fe3+/spermidine/putrescine transport system ATPase subunit
MLSVRNLSKSFPERGGGRKVAVDGLSLEVGAGQLFTLLGPSGCGKTTTLRCVAGLERPDSGEIAVAERVLFSSETGVEVPASERGLGVVFQSYALWPHMSVFETVAFPLKVMPRRSRPPRIELRERVERVLSVVRLDGLAGRSATELSGGQQQRLALARALAVEPPLLLMDEPLSSLDAGLREEMRFELKRLQRDLGVTAVHVTHDQAEALALSNVIAVMSEGRVEQIGTPPDIYRRPRSRFVAEFLGSANLIDGVVDRRDSDGSYAISTPEGWIRATHNGAFAPGSSVVVAIRAEDIRIEPGESEDSRPNHWLGTVRARAFRGDAIDHVVGVGDDELRVRAPAAVSIVPGTKVTLAFSEAACLLLPSDG